MNRPELVVDVKAMLGEGPCWDDTQQLLYWVDILNHNVHIYDPALNSLKVINTNQYVGAVVPRSSGGLIVALYNGFYSLDPETETLTPIVDPEKDKPTNRFNDGKCDSSGRFWAGTMSLDGALNEGALYYLDKDLSVKKVLENVSTSNGLAWDFEGRTMYYIDTPTKKVRAFDFDRVTGDISNERVVIDFPENEGFPDGMNIDNEGMLWIAHWGGGQVSRWNPNTGEKVDSIMVPAPLVTSCEFGGKDLDELYITTARIGLSEEEIQKYPHAGSLFKVKPGVKGIKTYGFKG
jgi:sugar lactone lactonase YvrE